uniref:SnoaL-like domain-containing protein n=1 Tax=Araucaria cunninghamii TaxID=56994 RepID=A0A0D6QUR5_ARACU
MAISALQSIRGGNTNRNGVCVPSLPHRGLADITAKNKRNGFRFSLKCKGMTMAQGGANKGNSVVLDASTRTDIVQAPRSAVDIVREFYAQINRHQVDSVGDLIAEDCVYEDLVFPQPFVGRKDIIDFFKRFTDAVSTDLQFVIDDITSDDASAVGVTWHLEWRGKTFPFSKGCSFYRCALFNGKRQIIYGRDSVEPATKPGDMALVAIKAVTSLLERFPQLADRF